MECPANASVNAISSLSDANHKVSSPVNSKVEALADFLSPALGQTSGSPPVGLRDSIHNRCGAQLSGVSVNKSNYQMDLEDLIAKGANKGNAFDHKVVKATEGISRLSLN